MNYPYMIFVEFMPVKEISKSIYSTWQGIRYFMRYVTRETCDKSETCVGTRVTDLSNLGLKTLKLVNQ